MKGSGTLIASVLAASTVALTSSSAGNTDLPLSSSSTKSCRTQPKTTPEKDKFAPKFDGLRFIETLVTAHR